MKDKIRAAAGMLLILVGVLIFLFPTLRTAWMDYQTEVRWEQWIQSDDSEEAYKGDAVGEGDDSMKNYEWIQAYNEELAANRQVNFNNEAIVEQVPDQLKHLEDSVFGFIEVPAMDLLLPLYMGASEEHLAQGAAVLGETSLPIGGISTNSVIAAHRGYGGMPFFRRIEDLAVGDSVYITNLWGRLHYTVDEIRILEPHESEALLIREGEDRITLLTCHPYRSHGRKRYAVFCRRNKDAEDTMPDLGREGQEESDSDEEQEQRSDGNRSSKDENDDRKENASVEDSSKWDLLRESLTRRIGGGLILLCFLAAWIHQRN